MKTGSYFFHAAIIPRFTYEDKLLANHMEYHSVVGTHRGAVSKKHRPEVVQTQVLFNRI